MNYVVRHLNRGAKKGTPSKFTIPFNGTGSGSALPNQTDLNRTHLYASKINNQTRAYHRTLYTKNRVEMPMD